MIPWAVGTLVLAAGSGAAWVSSPAGSVSHDAASLLAFVGVLAVPPAAAVSVAGGLLEPSRAGVRTVLASILAAYVAVVVFALAFRPSGTDVRTRATGLAGAAVVWLSAAAIEPAVRRLRTGAGSRPEPRG